MKMLLMISTLVSLLQRSKTNSTVIATETRFAQNIQESALEDSDTITMRAHVSPSISVRNCADEARLSTHVKFVPVLTSQSSKTSTHANQSLSCHITRITTAMDPTGQEDHQDLPHSTDHIVLGMVDLDLMLLIMEVIFHIARDIQDTVEATLLTRHTVEGLTFHTDHQDRESHIHNYGLLTVVMDLIKQVLTATICQASDMVHHLTEVVSAHIMVVLNAMEVIVDLMVVVDTAGDM